MTEEIKDDSVESEEKVSEKDSETKMEILMKMREEQEDGLWELRTAVKFVEVLGFVGTFLCTDPVGYFASVVILAIAIVADYYLAYKEHKQFRHFNNAMYVAEGAYA